MRCYLTNSGFGSKLVNHVINGLLDKSSRRGPGSTCGTKERAFVAAPTLQPNRQVRLCPIGQVYDPFLVALASNFEC